MYYVIASNNEQCKTVARCESKMEALNTMCNMAGNYPGFGLEVNPTPLGEIDLVEEHGDPTKDIKYLPQWNKGRNCYRRQGTLAENPYRLIGRPDLSIAWDIGFIKEKKFCETGEVL